MTDAERTLWNLLRGKQMAGLKFCRQHPFEGYILDFVCRTKKIVIEIDGGNIRSAQRKMASEKRVRGLSRPAFLEP